MPCEMCTVCGKKKSVDLSHPQGLCSTYCGIFCHSNCSGISSAVNPEHLSVVQEVCCPCPNCEDSSIVLPHLKISLKSLFQGLRWLL